LSINDADTNIPGFNADVNTAVLGGFLGAIDNF